MKKFHYDWSLKEADFARDKGTVFSCFSGGGGSSMGYKLAGFDVIGCNEIDPRLLSVYLENLSVQHVFQQPIQELKNGMALPEELYRLDILDGSPPCSSFSWAGARERDWGKKKRFSEGLHEQVLDDLFSTLRHWLTNCNRRLLLLKTSPGS